MTATRPSATGRLAAWLLAGVLVLSGLLPHQLAPLATGVVICTPEGRTTIDPTDGAPVPAGNGSFDCLHCVLCCCPPPSAPLAAVATVAVVHAGIVVDAAPDRAPAPRQVQLWPRARPRAPPPA